MCRGLNGTFTTYCNGTNSTSNATSNAVLPLDETAKMAMYISYGVIFIVGTFGNALVIYFIGIKRTLSRSFDIQIISLAISDFLAAIFTPLVSVHDLYTNFSSWYLLGTFGCKIFVPMNHITTIVSSFTLITISVERIRVIGSVRTIRRSAKSSILLNLVVWILSIAMVTPYMVIGSVRTIRRSAKSSILLNLVVWILSIAMVTPYMYAQEVNMHGCWASKWKPIETFTYYSVYTGVGCFLPVVLLVVIYTTAIYKLSQKDIPGDDKRLYEKRRKQYKAITLMFGCIAMLFFMLTTPYMVLQFLFSYYGTFDQDSYYKNFDILSSLHYAFYTLSQFNCTGNPFIYAKMQKKVKRTMTKHVFSIFRTAKSSISDIISNNTAESGVTSSTGGGKMSRDRFKRKAETEFTSI